MTNPMIDIINAEAESYEAAVAGDPETQLHSENIDGLPADIWYKVSRALHQSDEYAEVVHRSHNQHTVAHRSNRRTTCTCGWLGFHNKFAAHAGRRTIAALLTAIDLPASLDA